MPVIPILPNAYEGPPSIGLYQRNLLLAVYLYEYSDHAAREIGDFATLEFSLWTTGGWQSLAARDGALTIYHFGCAIEGLKNSLSACPSLNARIDRPPLRHAAKIFETSFPGYLAIRHVVAHVADLSKTIDKKVSHSVKGEFSKGGFRSSDPFGVTWLRGNMNGSTYAVTFEGQAFSYDLTRASVDKLRSIKELIYSAFKTVAIKA